MNTRELFLRHVAQTAPTPLGLSIKEAEGCWLTDDDGKKYIDFISGISVSNLGHRHPAVVAAIKKQVDKYMHVMVYGEYIQSPQVELAKLLTSFLPKNLSSVYFVNSGAEAIEGAVKLAKRFTGRTEMISFKNAYHGSTHGALSLMGDERLKQPFRPLLPNVKHLSFNNFDDLKNITSTTACVVVEPIQAEAGVILPKDNFLQQLRMRCTEVGALLILDEIQTGYGRTGKLFAFKHYNIVPDILCLAKGMGGGMPLGAFVSSQEIMQTLSINPELGHITTFGGNAVCCAAGLATLETITTTDYVKTVDEKAKLIAQSFKHPLLKQVRYKGLLMAFEFENFETNKRIIDKGIERGVITDWFLFNMQSMRIAPPLLITEDEIKIACNAFI